MSSYSDSSRSPQSQGDSPSASSTGTNLAGCADHTEGLGYSSEGDAQAGVTGAAGVEDLDILEGIIYDGDRISVPQEANTSRQSAVSTSKQSVASTSKQSVASTSGVVKVERASGTVGEDEESEVHPTTILLDSSETSEEDFQESEDDPIPLIPSTIETDETNYRSLAYKETTAAAFNSFWKYKKFPKGPKVRQTYELNVVPPQDPHKQIVFTDPVFDKSQTNTVRHFGKARIGEGNDITPNPDKLSQLGREIEYISEKMTSLGDSSKDRKEKMKLSSRICRMKRSANHEANKIKFAGLEKEREELSKVIRELRSALAAAAAEKSLSPERLAEDIYQTKVAGRTSEYVNSVLEKNEQQQSSTLEDFDISD